MTDHPVERQLRALLLWIAGCMILLVLAYAGQLYVNERDRRTLNEFQGRGAMLALSMHDAYAAALAVPGGTQGLSPVEEGAFVAATTVAFGRTLAYGEQLVALYTRTPGPPFDAGRRRLERALAQLRALRVEFDQDDRGLARAFSTRPLYIAIVSLQLERLHTIAAKELSAGIERRTRYSSFLFIASVTLLLSALTVQARRHLRAIKTTLRRETEIMDALRQSEARLDEAQRVAQLGSWELDPVSGRMTLSAELGRMVAAAGTGVDGDAFLAAIHPEDRQSVSALMAGQVGNGSPVELVLRLRAREDVERIVLLSGRESGEGETRRLFGTVQDITERRALESQLLQAQKMESIGRLAGGVAHEFNNLLTAITGNLSLALEGLALDDPRYHPLREAADATSSAAQVTRQLLTFSRRQVIDPKVVDLNDVVGRARRILDRLIGEDIHLRVTLQRPLGRVRIDPVQVEQMLINLAVNARDAMPAGGTLTIETADVALDEGYCRRHPQACPGQFVMVAVSDDGQGLSAEDKAHLFEPFYTTKTLGRGTGLGLPMVYGSVEQHGGSIEVDSEAGTGTTFRVYLPRADEDLSPPTAPAAGHAAGGIETIVLVEDEESVRTVATRVLQRRGYTVHGFETAEDALSAIAAIEAPVHLLITDVVLPGVNGAVLAERMRTLRPGIPVLFTSGYTGKVLARYGVLDPDIEFLAKPYSIESLTARVRDLLDGQRG